MTTPNTLTVTVPATVSPDRLALVETEAKTILTAVLTSMGVLDLTPDFTRRRDALIADAKAVAQVQNTDDEASANAAYKALNALKKEVEAQSAGFKAPLNAAKTRIIDITDAGLDPVLKAQKRLKSMCDGFTQETLDRKKAEEAKALAEKTKRDKEAADALEAAQKLAELASKANNPEDAAMLLERAQEAQDAAEAAAMMPVVQVADITHARGYSAREIRDFGIIGAPDDFRMAKSTEQFARWIFTHRLDLVRFLRIEIKRADMLDALKDEQFLKGETPPGVKIFNRIASSIR